MTGLLAQTVLLGLAAYRVTRLIVKDSIFDAPRARLVWWLNDLRHDGVRVGKHKPHPKLAELIECPWCMGVWVSFATVWLLMQYVAVPLPWLQATAAAAIVGIVSAKVDE